MYNCTHSYKIIKEHNYPTEFYIYKWHQFLQSQIGPASIQSRSFVELSPCWASVVVAVSVLALVVQAPEGFRSEDSPKDWSAGSSSPPCPWRNALPVVPSEFKIFIFHGIIASLHHCIMSRLSAPWAVYWPLYHGWNQDEIKALTGSISSAASTGNWHMHTHWTHSSRMISGFVPQVTSNIWKPKSTEQFSISEGLNGFQLWSWDLFLDIKHQSPFLVHQAGETCEFHDGLLKFKTRDCTESNKTQAVAGVRGDFASSCLKIPEGASRTQRSQSIEIHANSTPQEMLFQRACKPGMSNDFVSRPPMKSRSHPTTATVEKFSLSTQPEMQVRANWVACYPTGSRPWAVANSHSLIPQYHVIHDQFIHIRYISPPRLDLLRWCFRDFRKLHGLHAHKRCGRMLDGLPDGLLDGLCDGLPDGLPDGRGRLRNAGGIGLCICDLSGLLVCTELVDRFR